MKPPKIPSLFKTKKPNSFYYEPRYYDEKKEKMAERRERIARELNNEKNEPASTEQFRSTLRQSWGYGRNRSENKGINRRVLVYIVVLVGLAYYFLIKK